VWNIWEVRGYIETLCYADMITQALAMRILSDFSSAEICVGHGVDLHDGSDTIRDMRKVE